MMRVLVVAILSLGFLCGIEAQSSPTYSTNFPLAENPISEGGRWINGEEVGIDWRNVRTSPGFAYGADASADPHYNDPTAILTGTWPADQYVQAKVRTVNQRRDVIQEVEIRLRSKLSAHRNQGYEVIFRCTHDGSQYVQIVRWNGPLGDFTRLRSLAGPGLYNGDVVKASAVGNVITAYINNVQVLQATDGTFTSGNPGMGFYLNSGAGAGTNVDYGFTSFTASGGGLAPAPPPTLRIVPSS